MHLLPEHLHSPFSSWWNLRYPPWTYVSAHLPLLCCPLRSFWSVLQPVLLPEFHSLSDPVLSAWSSCEVPVPVLPASLLQSYDPDSPELWVAFSDHHFLPVLRSTLVRIISSLHQLLSPIPLLSPDRKILPSGLFPVLPDHYIMFPLLIREDAFHNNCRNGHHLDCQTCNSGIDA